MRRVFIGLGGTDSRHYLPIADAVFRLDPFHLGPDDSARLHGTNERLAISDIVQGDAVLYVPDEGSEVAEKRTWRIAVGDDG